MILKWNKDNLKGIKPRGANASVRKVITLFPGLNAVTSEEYSAIKADIQDSIDAGLVEVIEGDSLKGMKPSEAVAMIKQCQNPATLAFWKQEAIHDGAVARALAEALGEMSMPESKAVLPVPGSEDDDDDKKETRLERRAREKAEREAAKKEAEKE